MKSTCIALDFDHTLAYYRDGYTGLFSIFTARGIPEVAARAAYEESKSQGGFSIHSLLRVLKSRGFSLDKKIVCEEFEHWLSNSLTLYPDAAELLHQSQPSPEVPIAIVTYGNPDYQKKKIQLLGIHYDRLLVVDVSGEKPRALRELVRHHGSPIAYIDDRASELDRIHRAGLRDEVHTIRILRPHGPYRDEKSLFSHREIQSLHEIFS